MDQSPFREAKRRNTYVFSVGKFLVNLPLRRTRSCWGIILKWLLRIGCEGFDWIYLAEDRKNGGPVGTML
jgi:hypothetical protein